MELCGHDVKWTADYRMQSKQFFASPLGEKERVRIGPDVSILPFVFAVVMV